MSKDESFIGRWSRLKRTEDTPETAEQQVPVPEQAEPAAADSDAVLALPSIESLTKDSDFTAFMKTGIPEELKRRALHTLWRSDPVFACLDGLNDYDGDFSLTGGVSEIIQTAWEVGKGFADHNDKIMQILPNDGDVTENKHNSTDETVSFSESDNSDVETDL